VELFRDANVDWLGRKWYFLSFSLVFSVAGILSMLFWHGIPKGVDFKGGTQVRVPFDSTPNEDHLRQALQQGGVKDFTLQRISASAGQQGNDVVITLGQSSATDAAHNQGRIQIVFSTEQPVDPEPYPDSRTHEQWAAFLSGLYEGWGNAWASPGPSHR